MAGRVARVRQPRVGEELVVRDVIDVDVDDALELGGLECAVVVVVAVAVVVPVVPAVGALGVGLEDVLFGTYKHKDPQQGSYVFGAEKRT